jgi:hypothetical protein
MDSLDKKFSDRIDDLYGIMIALLGGIFILIGFMFWDRRTLIFQAKKEISKEIELNLQTTSQTIQRELNDYFVKKSQFEKLLDFIKDLAKTNKEYEQLLHKHGLKIA